MHLDVLTGRLVELLVELHSSFTQSWAGVSASPCFLFVFPNTIDAWTDDISQATLYCLNLCKNETPTMRIYCWLLKRSSDENTPNEDLLKSVV